MTTNTDETAEERPGMLAWMQEQVTLEKAVRLFGPSGRSPGRLEYEISQGQVAMDVLGDKIEEYRSDLEYKRGWEPDYEEIIQQKQARVATLEAGVRHLRSDYYRILLTVVVLRLALSVSRVYATLGISNYAATDWFEFHPELAECEQEELDSKFISEADIAAYCSYRGTPSVDISEL